MATGKLSVRVGEDASAGRSTSKTLREAVRVGALFGGAAAVVGWIASLIQAAQDEALIIQSLRDVRDLGMVLGACILVCGIPTFGVALAVWAVVGARRCRSGGSATLGAAVLGVLIGGLATSTVVWIISALQFSDQVDASDRSAFNDIAFAFSTYWWLLLPASGAIGLLAARLRCSPRTRPS